MKEYIDLVKLVLEKGVEKKDRTNTGTKSLFGHQIRFDLTKGFPAVTTKKLLWNSVVYELLMFIKGDSNNNFLKDKKVNIWNQWACGVTGSLGPIYGTQWRSWPTSKNKTIDQLQNVIDNIKNIPWSRRLIVNSWNVEYIPDENMSHEQNINNGKMVLAPCHTMFQFYVCNNDLSCMLYQRSADVFLGLPFNIASYALLTHLVADVCNLNAKEFIWTGGDIHIYNNHIEQVNTQINRIPFDLPNIKINKRDKIDNYLFEDIILENYKYHPFIQGNVAV